MPSVAAPAHYQELAPMGFLPNRLWLNANAEYEEILHELRQQLDWLERGDGSKVLGRHRVELNTEYEQIWVLRASYEQDHTALLGPQADALLSGAQRVLSAIHDEGIALYHLYCKLSYVPRQTQQWLDMCARHLDLDAAKDIKVWYVGIQQRALMQKRHCVEVTDLLLTGKGLTLRRTLAELSVSILFVRGRKQTDVLLSCHPPCATASRCAS